MTAACWSTQTMTRSPGLDRDMHAGRLQLLQHDLDLLQRAPSAIAECSPGHHVGDLPRLPGAEIAVLADDHHVECWAASAPSSRMSASRRSPAVAMTPIREIRPRSSGLQGDPGLVHESPSMIIPGTLWE